ncbi:MAG: N-acetylmuramoyl-L-alanine amidase, partial [Chloroflexota bacterium]
IKGLPGHENDQVIVGSIGPWNAETPYDADPKGKYKANKIPGAPGAYPYHGHFGDFMIYLTDILKAIGPGNCDGIAIHAYSHGYHPDMVYNDQKMGPPFQNYYFNFFTYRDQMNAIPPAFRNLPVYLTEANGDHEPDGSTYANAGERWPDRNSGWIKNAYGEINDWNKNPSNQQIRCMILYRWSRDDAWHIDGKGQVHQDLREAVARNYTWNPDAKPSTSSGAASATTTPETAKPDAPAVTIPTTTGIEIQDIHATLASDASQTPYGTRNKSAIKRLIVHHTATPANVPVERIANFQVNNRKYPGISYHFCITSDGKAYLTQPMETVTRHAGQHSADSLGICLIGNFTNEAPSEAQLSSAAAVMAYALTELGLKAGDSTIMGYRDLERTASPGATWDTWKAPLITATGELTGKGGTTTVEAPAIEPEPAPTTPTPAPEPETPQTPPYQTTFTRNRTPKTASAGQTITVALTIKNTGAFTWVQGGPNPFRMGFRWFDSTGQMVQLPANFDFRTPLPRDVRPNQSVALQAQLRTPDEPGSYRLQWDMVHENITWFSSQGDAGAVIDGIAIQPAPEPQPEPTTPSQPTTEPAVTDGLQITDLTGTLPTNSSVAPYGQRNRRTIRRFVIHHTATNANVSVQRIANFQVRNQKKPGISYHFCVDAKGQIFQTQSLETLTLHAGKHSNTSVGICLIGNFSQQAPPEAQIDGAASLIASLGKTLNRTILPSVVVGYSELINTQSPGATWSSWKDRLVNKARAIQSGQATPSPTPAPATPATPANQKTIEHYLLFWHRGTGNWAEWDLVSAIDYIGQFKPTVGFSIEEAKSAKYVTIVGGPGGVPASAETVLKTAGCKVERLAGRNEEETNQMLYDLIAANKRFRTL